MKFVLVFLLVQFKDDFVHFTEVNYRKQIKFAPKEIITILQ